MALDIKQFLRDMKFSEADIEAMAPKFGAEQVGVLESGFVGPDERARIAAARTEIETRQTALTAKEESLNRDLLEWAGLTEAEKAKATDLQARLEKSEQAVLASRQALERVATQAGIDPKTVLPAETPTVTPKIETPTVDLSKYVPADQFARLQSYQADIAASMPFIAQQHFELTGKHLDTREILKEIRTRAASKTPVDMDPVAIWEQKYGIAQIRADREAKALADKIKEAEERGEERARTQMSIPGASQTSLSRRPSPVLNPVRQGDGRVGPRTSVLQRPQPGVAANRAVAAFRTGKYATKSA